MKYIKTFENYLNESTGGYSDDEITVCGVLQDIAYKQLKPNDTNDLEDYLQNASWIDSVSGNTSVQDLQKVVKTFFGGWDGTKNFVLGPTPDEEDSLAAKRKVEGLIKKGFKYMGVVDFDGDIRAVLGKEKASLKHLQVVTPLTTASEYMADIYGE